MAKGRYINFLNNNNNNNELSLKEHTRMQCLQRGRAVEKDTMKPRCVNRADKNQPTESNDLPTVQHKCHTHSDKWSTLLRKNCKTENYWLKLRISHAHTVLWECCKGDHQSQRQRANFDPQPTLNPLTDRHKNLKGLITPRTSTITKIGLNPCRGFFSPHTQNIHL